MPADSSHNQPILLWSAPESRYSIEIPAALLEQLNGLALSAFRRLSRGGLEVGGLLFGEREETRLRILDWRQVECEHARGPGFLLSGRDRDLLVQQLEQAERDPQLNALVLLGFFVSHTKRGVCLSEEDLEIYNRFFPEPWQVVLVLHPVKGRPTQAGFFVREDGGLVRTETSYREFIIEGARPAEKMLEPNPSVSLGSASEPEPPSGISSEQLARPARAPVKATPKIPILAAALLVIFFVVFGIPQFASREAAPGSKDQVGLKVLAEGGHLHIEWNRHSRLVREADQAEFEITDGFRLTPIGLDASLLQTGTLAYAHQSGDVMVRLTLKRGREVIGRDLARWLGVASKFRQNPELTQIEESCAKLEAEVASLKQAIEKARAEERDLERQLERLSGLLSQPRR
ncbi:MAG: hypothetical protein NZV14_01575 [Bryobacteraceae bacterium]|nr:hypothetical protein [Bryobacteraceae bacterium]MDW8376819.1 hypothetical protein [Bryobacterales bacterium]